MKRKKERELFGLPSGLVFVLASILLLGTALVAMGLYFGNSGYGYYSEPPCEEYGNMRTRNVPARCLDYFMTERPGGEK